MTARNTRSIDKPIAAVLFVGMVISTVLIVVGALLYVIRPEHNLHMVLPLGHAIRTLPSMRPAAWLSVGLFALIVTPVARVIVAIASFAWVRDWKYTAVSIVVLTAMTAGMVLGKG